MIKGENQNLKQKILSNMTAPTCFQIDHNLCKSKELQKLLFVAQMTNTNIFRNELLYLFQTKHSFPIIEKKYTKFNIPK